MKHCDKLNIFTIFRIWFQTFPTKNMAHIRIRKTSDTLDPDGLKI